MPYVLAEPKVEEVKADEETRRSVDSHSDSGNSVSGSLYEVTAFTSGAESTGKHPDDPEYGITASGEHVRANHTAACPSSMAFGTRLEIEGVGERVCSDRGGKITEGRLDIYITELNDAQAFGRQRLNVRVID
jgi:3D (Asp-Asp-Asp) domain-containing protein